MLIPTLCLLSPAAAEANQLDFSVLSLSMVLPSEVLQVDASEARAEMEKIVKNKVREKSDLYLTVIYI